jgi:dihydrofolate synthase/folylpolyglutamate synthase
MNNESRYQQALDYLYSFIDYSLKGQKAMLTVDFNLERVFALMDSLGNPQQKYPSIHVAGSKGKGSVCAFCTAALLAQGYKVGLYTSPHLHDYRERIQINREIISQSDFISLVDEIKPHVAAVPHLTTFEIGTALAFWHFARQDVDVAVIEVGLGGRLDATNVVIPRVSVITALFLEHTLILGDTLAQIAAEKAGIIKTGIPVVLSPQKEEALRVVAQVAAKHDSPLFKVGHDYTFESLTTTLENQSFTIHSKKTDTLTELRIDLLGPHQIENATTAYAALQVLRDQGVAISEEAILEGFSTAEWPARFEIMQGNPPVVIDAAHTQEAAEKLGETVGIHFPNQPIVLVFGVSEDKNVRGILSVLLSKTKHIIYTKSTHPRAMDVDALMAIDLPLDVPTKGVENVGQAVAKAKQIAGDDAVVLVTGSIFVAADARAVLLQN